MVQLGKQVPRSCAPHLKMEEQTSRRITNATFSALRSNRRGIKFKMIRQGQTIDPISTKWKGTKRDGEKQQNRPGPFLYSLHPKKKKCGPDKKKKEKIVKRRFDLGTEANQKKTLNFIFRFLVGSSRFSFRCLLPLHPPTRTRSIGFDTAYIRRVAHTLKIYTTAATSLPTTKIASINSNKIYPIST